jgi:hypothetical protein
MCGRGCQDEQFCNMIRLSPDPDLRYSQRNSGYAVEHVLAYSGALPQVPYNQQLESAARGTRTGRCDSTELISRNRFPRSMVL